MRPPAPPALTRPTDFDSFWASTRRELAAVPLAVEREPGGERREDAELEELSFASLDGVRVRGYLMRATDDAPARSWCTRMATVDRRDACGPGRSTG